MEELQTILIIGAIINIIVLIVFFVMASNVSKILKHLTKRNNYTNYLDLAAEEIYIGNKEKAKEYLLKAEFNAKITYEKLKILVIPALGESNKEIEETKKDLITIANELNNL